MSRSFVVSMGLTGLALAKIPVTLDAVMLSKPAFSVLTRLQASGRPFLEVHREFRNRDVQNVSIPLLF